MKTIWRFTRLELFTLYGSAWVLGLCVMSIQIGLDAGRTISDLLSPYGFVGLAALLSSLNMIFLSVKRRRLGKATQKAAWSFKTLQLIGLYAWAFVVGAEVRLIPMNLDAGESLTYVLLANGLTGLSAAALSLITILQAKKQSALEAGSV